MASSASTPKKPRNPRSKVIKFDQAEQDLAAQLADTPDAWRAKRLVDSLYRADTPENVILTELLNSEDHSTLLVLENTLRNKCPHLPKGSVDVSAVFNVARLAVYAQDADLGSRFYQTLVEEKPRFQFLHHPWRRSL